MTTEPEKQTSSFFEQSSFTPVKQTIGSGWRPKGRSQRPSMPYVFPLAMLIACVLLAIVDLAFLMQVIGRVLDVGPMMSFFVSSGLGLVGLAFMMHLGYREADPNTHHISFANRFIHYSLWIILGLLIAAARFFAGPILEAAEDVSVWQVLRSGSDVRTEDVIFAPIMLLLYLITGIGAREALHNLLLNPDYHQSRSSKKQKRDLKTKDREEAKQASLAKIARDKQEREEAAKKALAEKQQDAQAKKEAEKKLLAEKQQDAQAKKEAEKKLFEAAQPLKEEAQKKAHQQQQLKVAKSEYFVEVKRYKNLESKFHDSYQNVSALIAKLEAIEGETQSITLARDNILGAIGKSRLGVQQQVAFLIQGRTKESIAELKAVIAAHNDQDRS